MLALSDFMALRLGSRCDVLRQVAINTLHYKVTGVTGASVSELEALAAFHTQFSTDYKALLSAQAFYIGQTIQRIWPLPLGMAIFSAGGAGVGTGGAAVLPGQTAGSLTKQTDLAGRSHRGRLYIPWPSETDSTDGFPTAGYLALLDSFAILAEATVVVTGAAGTATLGPVVWSSTLNSGRAMADIRVNEYWTTQRRRGSASPADY